MEPTSEDSTPEILGALFPLGFALDAQLRFAHVGPRLGSVVPEARVGSFVEDAFLLTRPRAPLTWPGLARLRNVACTFRAKSTPLELRGQCVRHGDLVWFAGGPLVQSSADLEAPKLSLGDFAAHDARLDLLVLVSAKDTALQDAQALAERLRELNAREASRSKALQGEVVRQEWVASLGRLVAGVAHEVNTPLGVAVTASSHAAETVRHLDAQFAAGSLKKSEFARLMNECREALGLVTSNLDRAASLISQFKQVAVDQTGSASRQVNVADYIRGVVTSLSPLVRRSAVEVEVVGEANVMANIKPGALSQIVTNLVQNALVHAFPDKKPGVLRFDVATLPDNVCRVRCTDDGVGMTQAVVARIFDPFFTTRLGQGGSGLGLFIVHNLCVDSLQGTIDVTSEPGVGTTFEFRFPMAS